MQERQSLPLEAAEVWGQTNRVRFDKQSDKCGYVIFAKRPKPDQEVRLTPWTRGLLAKKFV